MIAWKITVERITKKPDCGDEFCNCALHSKTDTWSFYPRALVIEADTGHRYEIKDGALLNTTNFEVRSTP